MVKVEGKTEVAAAKRPFGLAGADVLAEQTSVAKRRVGGAAGLAVRVLIEVAVPPTVALAASVAVARSVADVGRATRRNALADRAGAAANVGRVGRAIPAGDAV